MESILQLSNIDLIFTYTVKGKTGSSPRATSFVQNDILTPAFDDAVVCLILYWLIVLSYSYQRILGNIWFMLECINVLQTTHGNHRTLICAFLTSALISNLVKLDICALTCLTNSAICWLPPETSNVLVSLSRQSAYYSFLPKCRSF